MYGPDGELVGHVHDLRFEAAPPIREGAGGWTCRLAGLSCGTRAPVGHRLGYGTGDMAGPWPLSVPFRRRRERSLQIDWRHVVRVDGTRIDVAHRRSDYAARTKR